MYLPASTFCLFFALGLHTLPAQSPPQNQTFPLKAYVDQVADPFTSPNFVIPQNSHDIRFVMEELGRVRYRLKGIDPAWNQRTGAMYFGIRFYDLRGDHVSQETFLASGHSVGWKDSIEKSSFTQRSETITVPPRADHFSVFLSSAGPPSVIGVFAVTDIIVTDSSKQDLTLFSFESVISSLPEDKTKKIPRWVAGGTHPTMSKIVDILMPEGPHKALVLMDDDKDAHADWFTANEDGPKVTPGEHLKISWKELYNNGMGDNSSASYNSLAPGTYTFEVEALSLAGNPLNSKYHMKVVVPVPYWKNPWFWTACAICAGIILTLAIRYFVKRKIRRHLERAQLIEQERLRIARDLHDDLGTRLSHISLLSSHAESQTPAPEARGRFREINEMSQELMAALSETVWMLNPKNDDLESLISFLCRMITTLCKPSQIRCRIHAMPVLNEHPIDSDLRHQVSLAVKETIHNALKHSGATEIQVHIWYEASLLKISISDNGTGFLGAPENPGNGLANMQQRMNSIRGKCLVENSKESGTKILFEVPIN